MSKGKVECWNHEDDQVNSFYFEKRKKSLTLEQMEGNFSALMAGNLAMFTAFFCCCSVGPALASPENAILAASFVLLGGIGVYKLRENALRLLKKSGLLEIYCDMLKDLEYDIKAKIKNTKEVKLNNEQQKITDKEMMK